MIKKDSEEYRKVHAALVKHGHYKHAHATKMLDAARRHARHEGYMHQTAEDKKHERDAEKKRMEKKRVSGSHERYGEKKPMYQETKARADERRGAKRGEDRYMSRTTEAMRKYK